jgi:hypothetical protein
MQPLATTTLRHLSRAHGCFDDINSIGLNYGSFRGALSEHRPGSYFPGRPQQKFPGILLMDRLIDSRQLADFHKTFRVKA